MAIQETVFTVRDMTAPRDRPQPGPFTYTDFCRDVTALMPRADLYSLTGKINNELNMSMMYLMGDEVQRCFTSLLSQFMEKASQGQGNEAIPRDVAEQLAYVLDTSRKKSVSS